jgi:hypothetical protein
MIKSPVALSLGQWHHIAFTLAGNFMSIYIDGNSTVNGTACYVNQLNSLNVQMGVGAFIGFLDDVKILSKALSPAEMLMVYSG